MYERRSRDMSRRAFLYTAGLAGCMAIGGGTGYLLSSIDGNGSPPTEAQEGTPTPTPGPRPSGSIEVARDASLPALAPSPLALEMRARNLAVDIAAGVRYNAWSFGDEVPGPVVHVKRGDTVQFTLVNDAAEGHSMDFHSARTAPDQDYATIVPGDSISFDWIANDPGVFMYHCGTGPVLHHIANGMYGAVVVDPDTPFPPAREFVIVQSEFYAQPAAGGSWDADMNKMLATRPDLLAFNGVAFQYRDVPLQASVGELVRFYVVNAGPTLFSAFHVIGTVFDRVYVDGNPLNLLQGVSTYTVAPGQGCTFEFTLPRPGLYPFVTHSFAQTELGAIGIIQAV